MSKVQTIPLELSERPMLEVHVAAERIRIMPIEPGGIARVEVEGRRDDVSPIEIRHEGEKVILTSSSNPSAWPWPGAGVVKRLTLVVPEHVRARVQQEFGQLFVERLAGCDLDLATNAGQIELDHVRGRMKLVVDSGTVSGQGLSGTFDVVSSAGSVKLSIDALDAGEHRIRTAMGSVKVMLAPTVKVKLEAQTTLGSARLSHPSTPDAEAVMRLSAELGSVKVKTGDDTTDPRHGDWPDWRRLWRDVAGTLSEAIEDALPVTRPAARNAAAPRVPEAELRKVLELVEQGKITAPDAERLIRAMGA